MDNQFQTAVTADGIIRQHSSRLVSGGDPTAAAGMGATPNPAQIQRMTELQSSQNWVYAMLVGGLLIFAIAVRK